MASFFNICGSDLRFGLFFEVILGQTVEKKVLNHDLIREVE